MGTSHKRCSHIHSELSFLEIFFLHKLTMKEEKQRENMQKQTDTDKDLLVL